MRRETPKESATFPAVSTVKVDGNFKVTGVLDGNG